MGKLVSIRRQELPPDPLAGCRLMTDCGGPPRRKTPPGRAALTIALCAACLGCATACAAAPKLMYIIPMIATAVCAGISRRL